MSTPLHPDDDPGWRAVFGGGSGGRLSALRLVFAAVVVGVVTLGIVVLILEMSGAGVGTSAGGVAPGVLVAIVIVIGTGALVGGELVGRRPLDCSSDAALVNSYNLRFFLRIAVAEVPALVGFLGYVLSGGVELFLAGAAFSLVALYRAAPTVGRVAAETERLRTGGCGRNLVLALRTAAPSARRG